jgi:hypothetical protein
MADAANIKQAPRPRHPTVSLRDALSDPMLLGNTIVGDSWKPWRTLLIAANGEPLTEDERQLFRELTKRDHEPTEPVEEFVGAIGRRGGKSRAVSVEATYIAALRPHPALVSGETGIVLIIAPDQRQATICLDYITAIFEASPILKQLIETRTASELRLTNGIAIEVRASDFRRLRGPTYIAVICDESAFYMTSETSSNPDTEILAAVRPGLATTGGPTFMISSPYARRGELWTLYRKHFGPNGDPKILVAQAASKTMNATLPQSVVDRAFERDALSADAEYGGNFRRDIESVFNLETVLSNVDDGVIERPKEHYRTFHCFVDPSAGASDSFTCAIGFKDLQTKTMIVSAIREFRPPFSPASVIEEISNLCKAYGVGKVIADKFAGEFPRELFNRCGIRYEASARPKSELYQDLLMAINSKRVRLLDNPRLIQQLVGLERRTARSGKDSIDHSPGGHDDVCNAVAGLCAAALGQYGSYDYGYSAWSADPRINGDQPQQPEQQLPPPSCDGRWWQSTEAARRQPPGEADQKMRDFYNQLDSMSRIG